MSKESAMNLATTSTTTITPPISVVEPPAATSTIIPEKDQERFAKLAAKETEIQKAREVFKVEQESLYEEKRKARLVNEEYEKFQKLKQENPIEALKLTGFTETDIINFLAEKKEATPEEIATAKAQEIVATELKKRDEASALQATKEATERSERTIKSFREGISGVIQKDAEKYEFCAFKGPEAEAQIYENVLALYKTDPTLTPHNALLQAIEDAEKYYKDEAEDMTKKIKSLQPKVEIAPVKTPPQRIRSPSLPQIPQKEVATLTNKATATVASTVVKKETASEKKERLINQIRTHGLTR